MKETCLVQVSVRVCEGGMRAVLTFAGRGFLAPAPARQTLRLGGAL